MFMSLVMKLLLDECLSLLHLTFCLLINTFLPVPLFSDSPVNVWIPQ